jgi:hypothetical protein
MKKAAKVRAAAAAERQRNLALGTKLAKKLSKPLRPDERLRLERRLAGVRRVLEEKPT